MSEINFSNLAKEVVGDITSTKTGAIKSYGTPTYIAITPDGEIEDSELPYILKYAHIAVIILPFHYTVITQCDCSQYVIFISKNGVPNNKLKIDNWTLKFDTPTKDSYKTYVRYALISNDEFEMCLPVNCELNASHFEKVWKVFSNLSTNSTLQTLNELGDMYREIGGCPYGYSNITINPKGVDNNLK